MQIIDVTDAAGQVIAPQWLAAARPVHLELRPDLPADYPAKMQRVFAGGGRMCVAVEGQKVVKKVAGSLDDPFTVTALQDQDLSGDPARLVDEADVAGVQVLSRMRWDDP